MDSRRLLQSRRELADAASAAVVFVGYSRSPEVRFPVALEQSYAALQMVVERAEEWGLDRSLVALAGDSAGGNLAAAVALLVRERQGPEIAMQVLFCPMLDAQFDRGSYTEFSDGPPVTRAAMEWFWSAYAPDPAARVLPTACPLRAGAEQLRGVAPALVITSEFDVVRDEGEAYARKLTEAGVPVTAMRFNGTVHDFMMLNALAGATSSRAAVAIAGWQMRQAFARGSKRRTGQLHASSARSTAPFGE